MIAAIRRWIIEIVIIALVALVGFLWLRARHEAKVQTARAEAAEKARDKALQDAALGEAAIKRAQVLQGEVDAKEAQRQDALRRVADLEGALANHPVPPRPGAVPTEQAQVLADLRTMGTSPEPMAPARVVFPSTDAPTIWTWGKQALRVPGLEEHAKAVDNLNLGLKGALDTTQAELSTVTRQRDQFKEATVHLGDAATNERARGNNLQLQVGTLTVQRDRARTTRVYVGIGSFLLGVWAEHKLNH